MLSRGWAIVAKILFSPVSFSPPFTASRKGSRRPFCFCFCLFPPPPLSLSSRHPSSQEYHLALLINGSLLFPHLLASSQREITSSLPVHNDIGGSLPIQTLTGGGRGSVRDEQAQSEQQEKLKCCKEGHRHQIFNLTEEETNQLKNINRLMFVCSLLTNLFNTNTYTSNTPTPNRVAQCLDVPHIFQCLILISKK